MQYILVSGDRVLNGPRDWRRRSFEDTLREELGIEMSLPVDYTGSTPIIINQTVKIMPCEQTWPVYNSKIQYPHGPFWDLSGEIAQGTYEIRENSVEAIKNALKNVVANERYNKEIAGFKHTVQGIEVFIDTSRETRNIFVQRLLLMADGDSCTWKFPEAWLTLSKADLASIVSNGAAFVQGCFDWEAAKSAEIDACNTTAELDAIELRYL